MSPLWPFGRRAPARERATEIGGTYTLGGRRFNSIGESTVEHDHWFLDRIEDSGLGEITIGQHETQDAFTVRMLSQVRRDGRAFEMLGALIIPDGRTGLDWTPAMAAETAAFLKALHKPEDKLVLDGLLCSLLIHFFETGLSSLVRSQGSSVSGAQPAPAATHDVTAMDAGEISSGPSPGTTATAPAM